MTTKGILTYYPGLLRSPFTMLCEMDAYFYYPAKQMIFFLTSLEASAYLLCSAKQVNVCSSVCEPCYASLPSWGSEAYILTHAHTQIYINICMVQNTELFFSSDCLFYGFAISEIRTSYPLFIRGGSSSSRTRMGVILLELSLNVALSRSEYISLNWSEHISLS